jgi:hypothetical protein
MRLLTATNRRMKCSGLSRFGGGVAEAEVGAGETGGSATEVSWPQPASRSTGTISTAARVGRGPIEVLPPESAVDARHKVAGWAALGASP